METFYANIRQNRTRTGELFPDYAIAWSREQKPGLNITVEANPGKTIWETDFNVREAVKHAVGLAGF